MITDIYPIKAYILLFPYSPPYGKQDFKPPEIISSPIVSIAKPGKDAWYVVATKTKLRKKSWFLANPKQAKDALEKGTEDFFCPLSGELSASQGQMIGMPNKASEFIVAPLLVGYHKSTKTSVLVRLFWVSNKNFLQE